MTVVFCPSRQRIGNDGNLALVDSSRLNKGDTYALCNGTQIDGIVFRVLSVMTDTEETWYEVQAHCPPIYFGDQSYYVAHSAIEAYQERGQFDDSVSECAV